MQLRQIASSLGRGWETLAPDVVPDLDQHPLVYVRVVGLGDCRIDQASTLGGDADDRH